MNIGRIARRGAALAALVVVAGAGAAQAHHCYKEDWNEQAYHNQATNGSPWVSLTAMAQGFVPPEVQAACPTAISSVVSDFLVLKGMDREPLIHVNATVGSGAYYNKGKEPGGIRYLSEADFGWLEGELDARITACLSPES